MNKKIFASLILIVSVIGLMYYFPGCSTENDILNPETNQIYANGSLTPVNRTTVSGNMFVTDQNGNPIQGLDANNITARLRWDVLDIPDSVLGTVTITPATQNDIAAALTMDYSGSMLANQIQCMEDGVRAYINSKNSTDIAEIIKFASTVQVMQGFTSDTALLHQAVNTFASVGSQTALYLAINQGLLDASGISASQYLRTIIAFTDGMDNNSGLVTRDSVINHANGLGIPVFTVTLDDDSSSTGATNMRIIADNTGGFPFLVDPNNCGTLTTILYSNR